MTFKKSDFLEHIKNGSDQIVKSASPDKLAAEVTACPGWDLAKLCSHQGFVYRYAAEHLVNRAKEPLLGDGIPKPPEGGVELLDWYQESAEIIQSALRDVDWDEEIWNWGAGPKNAGFWFRRLSHETSIHAWDASSAANLDYEIDNDWGADGVDEYLKVMLPRGMDNRQDLPKPSGSLHLHRTDVGESASTADESGSGLSEWLCEIQNDELQVSPIHSKGDAAIQASGGDLHLWVWGRVKTDSPKIKLFGDEKVTEEWMAFCP